MTTLNLGWKEGTLDYRRKELLRRRGRPMWTRLQHNKKVRNVESDLVMGGFAAKKFTKIGHGERISQDAKRLFAPSPVSVALNQHRPTTSYIHGQRDRRNITMSRQKQKTKKKIKKERRQTLKGWGDDDESTLEYDDVDFDVDNNLGEGKRRPYSRRIRKERILFVPTKTGISASSPFVPLAITAGSKPYWNPPVMSLLKEKRANTHQRKLKKTIFGVRPKTAHK
eukprot:g1738.t1